MFQDGKQVTAAPICISGNGETDQSSDAAEEVDVDQNI